jgi:probable addiction module antidote protein
MMTKTLTLPWDVAEHLDTEEDMAAYLEAVLEENDPALVTVALTDIARAKEMRQIAVATGLARVRHGLEALAGERAPFSG